MPSSTHTTHESGKIIFPKKPLPPESPREYLYIAKALGSPVDEYKVGKTRQPPKKRIRSMGGQSTVQFELVVAYEVVNASLAERLAFSRIDAQGLRKYPGTKKETVIAPLDLLQDLCLICANTSITYSLEQKRNFLQTFEAPSPFLSNNVIRVVKGSKRLWEDALQYTIQYEGRMLCLKELFREALTSSATRKRLAKMGLHCCGVQSGSIVFNVDWQVSKNLRDFLVTRGHIASAHYSGVVQFKMH